MGLVKASIVKGTMRREKMISINRFLQITKVHIPWSSFKIQVHYRQLDKSIMGKYGIHVDTNPNWWPFALN